MENKKRILLNFIKEHPNTAHREIRKKLHMKVMKIYSGGLEEAFRKAGIESPRNFRKTTPEEKKKIVINYIRKHPESGGQTIKKETKIDFIKLFKNTERAFIAAGIKYPRGKLTKLRKRTKESRKIQLIDYLKKHPLENISEIGKRINVYPYTLFSSIDEIYSLAGLPKFNKWTKRKIKKQSIIIDYIKANPIATQRERLTSIVKRRCRNFLREEYLRLMKRQTLNFLSKD